MTGPTRATGAWPQRPPRHRPRCPRSRPPGDRGGRRRRHLDRHRDHQRGEQPVDHRTDRRCHGHPDRQFGHRLHHLPVGLHHGLRGRSPFTVTDLNSRDGDLYGLQRGRHRHPDSGGDLPGPGRVGSQLGVSASSTSEPPTGRRPRPSPLPSVTRRPAPSPLAGRSSHPGPGLRASSVIDPPRPRPPTPTVRWPPSP